MFEKAIQTDDSVGVVVLSLDEGTGPARLTGQTLTEALAGVVSVLRRGVDPMGAVVCRIQPLLIGVVAPDVDQPTLTRVIEAARVEIEKTSQSWGKARNLVLPRVRSTAGVAVRGPKPATHTDQPEHLVAAAASALRQALAGGGGCVKAQAAAKAA